MYKTFIENDKGYLNWLDEHREGFVINSHRISDPKYLVLHRARCSSISRPGVEPGAWTERGYIKICSEDINSLRAFVRENGRTDGTFSNECSFCCK